MAGSKTTTPRALLRPLSVRLRRFIVDHKLLRPGRRVLAGVSGGPDSTCLLLVLAALRRSLRFELHAAYFDHRLRGERAGARERRFVRTLCEGLDVPLHTGAGDVRAHGRRRSLEEAARELRYSFLAQTARDARCDTVAVGHTRDDQAETVLLHIIRGSGLRGLAAMAPDAPWPVPTPQQVDGPRLVRPLLCLSRAETERACRRAGVTPLRDPSNRSRAFLRNRVRLDLLPKLRRYNARIDEALVRLADAAAADVALLERLAADALTAEPSDAGTVRVSRRRLASLPAALQRHAVRLAVARLLGGPEGLAERHVRAVLRANEGGAGATLHLPRGLRVEVGREEIVLTTASHVPRALPDGGVTLSVPGTARFGGWRFEAEVLSEAPEELTTNDSHVAVLDARACGDRLLVRRRRRGDRFHPLGMGQAKKLQDFFVDAHIPRVERDAVPLVCAERGIAWVVGQRPAEWAKVDRRRPRVVRVTARPSSRL